MSDDIFTLGSNNAFNDLFPHSRELPSSELNNESIQYILSNCMTKFFYVVDPNVLIKEFEFKYRPEKYDEDYVHIWQNSDAVRLFRRSVVSKNPDNFTDEALKRGRVQLKIHDTIIFEDEDVRKIQNEPDVFVIANKVPYTEKFRNMLGISQDRIKVIKANNGLTENVLNNILSQCESYYFYIVDTRIVMNSEFDFTFVPVHWDSGYMHVWNECPGIRLCNTAIVETDILTFTDEAWEQGKSKFKNVDLNLCEIPESKNRELILETNNDIFVIGSEPGKWFKDFKESVPNRCTYIVGTSLNQPIIDEIKRQNQTGYCYVVQDGIHVKNTFNFTFIPETEWEDNLIHIWNKKPSILFFNANYLPDNFVLKELEFRYHNEDIYLPGKEWPLFTDMNQTNDCEEAFFFLLKDDALLVEDFDLSYVPDIWDSEKLHVWQRLNPHTMKTYDYSGLYLVPNTGLSEYDKHYVRSPGCVSEGYDVIYLSYKEEFADANFEELVKIVPHAKRVHGVKGIYEAHKKAAEIAETSMFFVVDADAKLEQSFDFSFMPRKEDEHKVYVWRSKNPINDLIYGYGGVKLFPTQVLRDASEYKVDFTTSISKDFVPIAAISNTTMIDTDEFTAWKSAFRECVKLASGIIDEDQDTERLQRLDVWCTKGADRTFGEAAIAGAKFGREYGIKNKNNKNKLEKINDYEWIVKRYEQNC